ncbi:receptor-type tyrosine-protein phosphatase mu [Plakobranchus ocellatus]|uniref:Receptor-type tyrosine-protein phosphatase mu n=1 Tax=Plakobranchus ocellatus TaxID=259542 RepID=A0AAV3YAS8_9GAST|nr:receptor-type tyrosine-protein phosphatase mu [Plakobranchus ocellatus]
MYWPEEEEEEVTFAEIKVKLLTTKVFAEYTIRKMQLSKDQYKFLHHAALVGYIAAGTNIPVREISARFKRLDSHQNNGYRQEFDALSAACVENISESTQIPDDKEDEYEEIQTVINKQKNRFSNIVPKNAYMPELTCEVKTMDKYIIAVLVPVRNPLYFISLQITISFSILYSSFFKSLTKTRHNILTQLPLPSTVTDFWRLVTQYNVGLVVAFQADSRHTDETIGDFLPSSESEPMRGAVFEIHATIKEEHRLWQELSVTVSKKKKTLLGNLAEQHLVTCLLCKNFTLDPETVVEYLKKVKVCKPGDQLRTLYTSRNGADQCGLMYVQSILLDKLEADHCLAVPLVVGTIKAIRPHVIATLDEYMCLYKVLRLIYEANNDYGNLENGEPQQSKRDASINKAKSPTHANQAFQQEEPDNSLKSNVNTITTVSEEQSGTPKPHTGLVSIPRKQAAKNVVDEYGVLVDVSGETDTYVEMSRGDPCSAKEHP